MIWEKHVRRAEALLGSSRVPGAEEIISHIKRVNPTSLQLSEADRETGYRLKDSLQNLLLENYGGTFRLVPHPYSKNILLIRHRSNPTIDACHIHNSLLSARALDALQEPSCIQVPAATTKPSPKKKQKRAKCNTPAREALAVAQRLLVEYDYAGAEETLAAIQVRNRSESAPLIKAVRILVEEMGAYESAAATILAQPDYVQADRQVRELLALTCYGRDMIPEARALFENLRPDALCKSALFACADISFRDGNLSAALSLLKLAEAKEGILPAETELRNKIERCMQAEAEPLLLKARPALAAGDLDQAEAVIRQALARYPHYPEGRSLLREIEATRAEEEIKALWLEFEASTYPQERLNALTKLREVDRNGADRVRALIEKEKNLLKLQSVEQRLCELRALAAAEQWPGCFDILMWLSREGEAGTLEEACAISPLFSVLQGNRRLMKVPGAEAKEIWLTFVAVKARISAGRRTGCLERLEKIKPYFYGYAGFHEEYDDLMETERELARSAASDLMIRMMRAESLAEARIYAARSRRVTAKLPADEIARFREHADMVLSWHTYVNSEDDKLEDYRIAVTIGNAARAAALRDSIDDREKVASIDREIAEYFAIEVEPVTVVVSPDADLDLATKPRVPLTLLGESLLHTLFREDDETILVISVAKGTAARYRSPHFKDLGFMDSIPDRDLFLFGNIAVPNHLWRAKLSETDPCFLAEILINENFTYEEHACFRGILMSSSKDNDYYTCIVEGENIRVIRQSLDVASSTVRTFHAKGEVTCVDRGSYRPDTIFLGTETGTFLLNSNLDLPHGQSRTARTIPMQTFAVDCDKLQVYIREGVVKVLNSKLKIIKQYPNSVAGGLICRSGVQGLCTETDVALLSLAEGKGTFYNLNTNKFSQTIALERIMRTDTPTRWHAFDYDKDASTLLLRDITGQLDTLLEWRVICTADEDDDTQLAKVRQFEDPTFFSLPPRTPPQTNAESAPGPG